MESKLNYIFLTLFLTLFNSSFSQVGINTTTPMSALDVNGNLTIKEVGIANANVAGSTAFFGGPGGNATPINDGVYVSLTPTSGNQEFIVPNAVNFPGRIYILRNISASINAVLYSFGGKFFAKDTKDPTPPTGTSFLTMPSNALLKTVILISDGENWTYIF